jgi:serine/threonine protein kinase
MKKNIVQVVNFREDSVPFLMMSYLSLENLENLHSESLIAVKETIEIFSQTLNALQYLHSRDVIHRDLKSKNILIESRSSLSIKLADFDLANDRPDLKTICDTQQYIAPEIYLRSKYTASVNL